MKRKQVTIVVVIFLLLIVSVVITCVYIYNNLYKPTGEITKPVVVMVNRGDTFSDVAHSLKEKNAIENEKLFVALGRILEVERKIKAGEYEIKPNMSPIAILFNLLKGNVIEYSIMIPEGYNIYQIGDIIALNGLEDKDTFISLINDKEYIKTLGLKSSSLEGYLFPDTYKFNRGMSIQDIIALMIKRHETVFNEEKESWSENGASLELTEYEVLIIASIIEKETSGSGEREFVSAVFYNRLKKNMKLDSCATVIYGMWDTFDGNLTRADLERETSYNTYRISGLPPTPICNPGREAIHAAFNPADVDYLYFVSKNDGTHYFSNNLAEHNRAVYKYQKMRTYR